MRACVCVVCVIYRGPYDYIQSSSTVHNSNLYSCMSAPSCYHQAVRLLSEAKQGSELLTVN